MLVSLKVSSGWCYFLCICTVRCFGDTPKHFFFGSSTWERHAVGCSRTVRCLSRVKKYFLTFRIRPAPIFATTALLDSFGQVHQNASFIVAPTLWPTPLLGAKRTGVPFPGCQDHPRSATKAWDAQNLFQALFFFWGGGGEPGGSSNISRMSIKRDTKYFVLKAWEV